MKMSVAVVTFILFLPLSLAGCQSDPARATPTDLQRSPVPTSSTEDERPTAQPTEVAEDVFTQHQTPSGPWPLMTCPPTPEATMDMPNEPKGTPAGSGFITDQVGSPIEYLTNNFLWAGHAWVGQGRQGSIIVYSGADPNDQQQGVLIVVRKGTRWDPIGDWVEAPAKTGFLRIVDAVDSRLIVQSELGSIYYFDVPSGTFVNSLGATVATMTPGPTVTPEPTLEPIRYSDDAPDDPGEVMFHPMGVDTELTRYIYPAGDQDWFLFRLLDRADLNFTLSHPTRNLALRVFRVREVADGSEFDEWRSSEAGVDPKIINIPDAIPCYYYVTVVGIGASADDDNPYRLEVLTK